MNRNVAGDRPIRSRANGATIYAAEARPVVKNGKNYQRVLIQQSREPRESGKQGREAGYFLGSLATDHFFVVQLTLATACCMGTTYTLREVLELFNY